MSYEIQNYVFKAHEKFLHFQASVKKEKILKYEIIKEKPFLPNDCRKGFFDDQGSSSPWTWAWTTDGAAFECWRPSGLQLRLVNQDIMLIRPTFLGNRINQIPTSKIKSLSIGKTSRFSLGLIGFGHEGQSYPLLKDTYPVMDAALNITYDGICEIEDLFPLIMMGRELARRLAISFNESPDGVSA